jgi:hypothetical protein
LTLFSAVHSEFKRNSGWIVEIRSQVLDNEGNAPGSFTKYTGIYFSFIPYDYVRKNSEDGNTTRILGQGVLSEQSVSGRFTVSPHTTYLCHNTLGHYKVASVRKREGHPYGIYYLELAGDSLV